MAEVGKKRIDGRTKKEIFSRKVFERIWCGGCGRGDQKWGTEKRKQEQPWEGKEGEWRSQKEQNFDGG